MKQPISTANTARKLFTLNSLSENIKFAEVSEPLEYFQMERESAFLQPDQDAESRFLDIMNELLLQEEKSKSENVVLCSDDQLRQNENALYLDDQTDFDFASPTPAPPQVEEDVLFAPFPASVGKSSKTLSKRSKKMNAQSNLDMKAIIKVENAHLAEEQQLLPQNTSPAPSDDDLQLLPQLGTASKGSRRVQKEAMKTM